MSDDIKAYELLLQLFDKNYKSVMTLRQLRGLSYELLLFYLLIIIVYANNSSITSVNNTIFNEKIDYTKSNHLLKCQLINQLSCAYINDSNFTNLYNYLEDVKQPINIHPKYVEIIKFLYATIFNPKNISSSRSYSFKKNLKGLIKNIYVLVMNAPYDNTKKFIQLKKPVISKIVNLLETIIPILYQYEIYTPSDTYGNGKTDLDDLDDIGDSISIYSDKLQELYDED